MKVKFFFLFYRLWIYGVKDELGKSILYDLCGSRNFFCVNDVLVNWWVFEYVFSVYVLMSEEKVGNEEYWSFKYSEYGGFIWFICNDGYCMFWSIYFLLLWEMDIF